MEISSRPASLLRSGRKPFAIGADSENVLAGGASKGGKAGKTPVSRRALGDISNAKNGKSKSSGLGGKGGGGLGGVNGKVRGSNRKALGQLSNNTNNATNGTKTPGSVLKFNTPSTTKPTTANRTSFKALATPTANPTKLKSKQPQMRLGGSKLNKPKQHAPRVSVATTPVAAFDGNRDDVFDQEFFAGRLAPLDADEFDDGLDVVALLKGTALVNAVERCQQQQALLSAVPPTVAPLEELSESDYTKQEGEEEDDAWFAPTAVSFDFDECENDDDDDADKYDCASIGGGGGWFADESFGMGEQQQGNNSAAAATSNNKNNGWFDDGFLDDADDPWA